MTEYDEHNERSRAARQRARKLAIDREPADTLDQVAYWSALWSLAEEQLEARLSQGRDEGQQWWILGSAAGRPHEPLRQWWIRRQKG